jgi:hypothetical protein
MMPHLQVADEAIEFRDQTVVRLLELTLKAATEIARSRGADRVTREHMEEAVQAVLRSLVEGQFEAALPRKAAAASLVDGWLREESDYDQRVWPRLAGEIERNRLSDRKRLSG